MSEVEDRVRIVEKREVEITVKQEDISFESIGEMVKIYQGGNLAILARSEWDQIVGAL